MTQYNEASDMMWHSGLGGGMYQERRKRLIKLVKQELKVRGIKL